MRVLNFIMMAMFLLAAAVQYNDPDPMRWIVLYGIAAAMSGLAMFNQYGPWPAAPAAVYLAIFLYLKPDTLDHWIEVETAREAGGALICLVWMLVLLAIWGYRRRGKAGAASKAA